MARRTAFVSILGLVALFLATPGASADWAKVPAGAASLNRSSANSATEPSVASIDGVPYVTWREFDGSHFQQYVDRLAANGSGWEQVGGSLNRNPAESVNFDSIADVGGVPYVAWSESKAGIYQIYVDRLNGAGNWEAVGDSLNRDASQLASHPSLTSVGGVLYVAWSESDGTNNQTYVDRLAADGTTWQPVGGSLNRDTSRPAYEPTIAEVDGVPYVAWYEQLTSTFRVFVDRLHPDGVTWDPIGIRLNRSATSKAFSPHITSVNGVPYVALTEFDTGTEQAYVDRLDPDGTTWDPVGSSLNRDPGGNSLNARIVSVAGSPYVSWDEQDGSVPYVVHVDRLGADGTSWEAVGMPTLNDSASNEASGWSLATIQGVPYVGWFENQGAVSQVRVSRLEPEFGATTAAPTADGSTFTTEVHTYGIGYPIGFDYGGVLEKSTTPTPAPAGSDVATISQTVNGLPPSADLFFRPFATAGVGEPRVLGPTQRFATLPDTTRPDVFFDKKPRNKVDGSKAKYRFSSSDPAATFECKFDRHGYKPCASPDKLKHLDPGKHRFKVKSIDPAGNVSHVAKDRFKVV